MRIAMLFCQSPVFSTRVALMLSFAVTSVGGCAEPTKIGCKLNTMAVGSAAFTPDSKYVVAACFSKLVLLDVASQKIIDRFHEDETGRQFGLVAVSPDGKYVASAGGRSRMSLWDFQTGKLVRSFPVDDTRVCALSFSQDGKWLAAGTGFRIHESPRQYEGSFQIWVWDMTKGDSNKIRFRGHEAPVRGIAFLRDGKHMVSIGADPTLRLWDVATQKEIRQIGTSTVKTRVTPFPVNLRFDAQEKRFYELLDAENASLSVMVSRDGRYVVQGRLIWDVASWKLVPWSHISLGAEEKETNISFNAIGAITPDNKRLIVGEPRGADFSGTLAIYDIGTGKEIYANTVFRNRAKLFAAATSPDGHFALAAGSGLIPGFDALLSKLPTEDGNQLYLYRLPR